MYKPGEEHWVVGDDGADQDIPEMSDISDYGPFPADVFILGNVFKKHFIPVRSFIYPHVLSTNPFQIRCTIT